MSLTTQILESLGDPVIAVDRGGGVVVWTQAAERLLGYPAADVLGGGLPDLGVRLDMLLAGREGRLTTLRRRDGGTFPATVTATHLLGPEGELQGVVLLVKDLRPWTGPAGEEAAGGEAQIVEERLGAAFRGMVEMTNRDPERGARLEALAQSLAEQGRRLLPGISCLIALVPPGRQEVVHCLAGAGLLAETLVNQSFPRETSVVGSALARNEVVERSDMQLAARSPELFVAAGVNTMRVVPMSAPRPLPDGRRALGATVYFRAEARPFTAAERRLLDDFGALVAMSVTRAELQATAERLTAQLQLAVDVARDLARSLDVAEVIRRLTRRAAVATGADRCALVRVEDGADGELVTVAIYDASGHEGGIGFRQPIHARRTLLEAVLTRAPVLAGPADLDGFPPDLRRGLQDIRHAAMIPLLYGGQVIAVLVVSRRRGRAFTQEEVDTAMLLGGPAALALRNSYLYAQTEEASRVKTDFLDMAAHELRTPLTVISGYLSILREGAFGPAPPGWQDPLRILDAKATELRQLVDDLLLAARLETGRLESARHPVDLREIAEQAVEAADQLPELTLPEDPVMVRGDRDQLARLVDHLVANALAYGRDGKPPWARVRLEPRADEGVARLTVDDRGRGLPPGAGDRIFERFARLEDPDQPMVPGTGLGLYIARELARRHGGWVELEWAQPGVGSRFVLTLPLLEGATHLDREDE